jgi:hypothetical protein
MQMRLQFLEHGFYGPALTIQLGDELGARHRFRYIGEDEDFFLAIAGCLLEAHPYAAICARFALGIDDPDPLLIDPGLSTSAGIGNQ